MPRSVSLLLRVWFSDFRPTACLAVLTLGPHKIIDNSNQSPVTEVARAAMISVVAINIAVVLSASVAC